MKTCIEPYKSWQNYGWNQCRFSSFSEFISRIILKSLAKCTRYGLHFHLISPKHILWLQFRANFIQLYLSFKILWFAPQVIISLSLLVVVCNAQFPAVPIARALAPGLENNQPQPYSYGYQTSDEFGTTWTREESSDGNGNVRGSYSYREANGIGRTVEYVVDPVNGFRANVQTNEPGTIDSAPAGVLYRTSNN